MSDEIEACPHCDSSSIYANPGDGGRGKYGCYSCHEGFDRPATRDRKPGGTKRKGLAARLLRAKPEDVSRETARRARRDEPDAAIQNRGGA